MPVSYTFPSGMPTVTSDSSGYDEEPRVKSAKFGDGYKQTAVDGLNAIERNLTPVWEPLTETQKNTIRDFFRARAGSEPFFYTLPNGDGVIKVRAIKWSVKPKGTRSQWSVSATFEECFDVG